MTDPAARWERVEALCQAALERPASERVAFLESACDGDTDLLREVEQLLAQESAAEGFLGLPHATARARLRSGPAFAGTRLGDLEICELIGAGATGEVYRARDTVLDRDVAVKILSEPYASGDHLVRFEREARILASLNHPNIAQVYGLQRTDGVPALVMELVSGHTLSDVSTGDASSLKHRLETAQQIAGALDAAHERGVIHKDLKPSNIKVRPDGTVKILDFGLAKTIDPPGLSPHDCPAADEPLTRTGTILGTVAYMSPEQARGLAADRRSDLWALGVVLYELLAGRALFQRGTTADTLAAVLTAEPDWRALPSELPEGIRILIRRCLHRDGTKRLDSARTAVLELDDALSDWRERRASQSAVPRWRQLDLLSGQVLHAKFSDSKGTVLASLSRHGASPRLLRVRADGHGSRKLNLRADILAVSQDETLALLLETGLPLVEHGVGTLAYSQPGDGLAPRHVLGNVVDADWSVGNAIAVAAQEPATLLFRVEYPIGNVLHTDPHIRAISLCADGRHIGFLQGTDANRLSLYIVGWSAPLRLLASGPISAIGRSPHNHEVLCTIRVSLDEAALFAIGFDGRRRELCRFDSSVSLCDVSAQGSVLLRRRSFKKQERLEEPKRSETRTLSRAASRSARHEVSQLVVVDAVL